VLGLALLVIGGCYPYERHVTLAYDVPSGAGPRFDGNDVPVVVADFLDGRPNRQVIGHISSAALVTSPDVTADNDPGSWIADALRKASTPSSPAARVAVTQPHLLPPPDKNGQRISQ
jgi:hypothetical protein